MHVYDSVFGNGSWFVVERGARFICSHLPNVFSFQPVVILLLRARWYVGVSAVLVGVIMVVGARSGYDR